MSLPQQLNVSGYDLILVSRKGELLKQLKDKLAKNNQIHVEMVSLDLTETSAQQRGQVFLYHIIHMFSILCLLSKSNVVTY